MKVKDEVGARAVVEMEDGSMVKLKIVPLKMDDCQGCVFAHYNEKGERECHSGYLLCMSGMWVRDEEGGEE